MRRFMRGLLAGALLLPGIAQAASSASPPLAPPSSFTITVSDKELALIAKVLQDQPYRDVVDLLNKLQLQINAQATPPKQEKDQDSGKGK